MGLKNMLRKYPAHLTSSILLFCVGSPRSKRSVSLLRTKYGQLSRGRSENSLAHCCNPPWAKTRTRQDAAKKKPGRKAPTKEIYTSY